MNHFRLTCCKTLFTTEIFHKTMSTVHPVDCNSSDINSVINLYILRPQYEDFLKKGFGINL